MENGGNRTKSLPESGAFEGGEGKRNMKNG